MPAERPWQNGAGIAEACDFGPAMADVQPVGHVVGEVTRLRGDGAHGQVADDRTSGHEAGLLAVDTAKAQARLGWHPRLRLRDALEWTIRWYRAHRAGEPAQDLVLADIARYEILERAHS